MNKLFGILICFFSLTACGQQKNKTTVEKPTHTKQQTEKQEIMDLSNLTNEQVKSAFQAFQSGDKSWYSYFTENPVMTDDGNTIDFKNFFSKALGTEKFLTIDKVENEGKDIYGNFKAGQWGTFKVFFKFHQNADGKFDRLDIGQANY